MLPCLSRFFFIIRIKFYFVGIVVFSNKVRYLYTANSVPYKHILLRNHALITTFPNQIREKKFSL